MATGGSDPLTAWRNARRHPKDKPPDVRSAAQRDRDRLLYSSAFRRLGGVTQVVWAKEEGHLFHNRLTHSLKVAQVGRRLAEKMLKEATGSRQKRAIQDRGGLDPDTVEAAGLAHDLGHPPFGHIGEEELRDSVKRIPVDDSFEGNAQSFRIVTKLAAIDENVVGLNLSRGTLNAILKYPLMSDSGEGKFGAYEPERDDFQWAREDITVSDGVPTLEAQLMDWADDIAYAVHDVEDFYRAGLIPITNVRMPDQERVFERVIDKWEPKYGDTPSRAELAEVLVGTIGWATFLELTWPFNGTRTERARLRSFTSHRINRLVGATRTTSRDLRSTQVPVPKSNS